MLTLPSCFLFDQNISFWTAEWMSSLSTHPRCHLSLCLIVMLVTLSLSSSLSLSYSLPVWLLHYCHHCHLCHLRYFIPLRLIVALFLFVSNVSILIVIISLSRFDYCVVGVVAAVIGIITSLSLIVALSSSASSIALSMFDCCIIATICIVIVIPLSAWFLRFCCHCHCRCCCHLSCIVVTRSISLATSSPRALSLWALRHCRHESDDIVISSAIYPRLTTSSLRE